MFRTALLAMVRELPASVPPVQLNCAPMTTVAVRLMEPLPTLTVSFEAGTPAGVQLVGLNQSPLAEPVQVRLVWAEARFTVAKQSSPIIAPTSKRLAFIQDGDTKPASRPDDKRRAITTGPSSLAQFSKMFARAAAPITQISTGLRRRKNEG